MNKFYNIVCIGSGGTGGNFAKEFARYLSAVQLEDTRITFTLVDGDIIEEKNYERQPFFLDNLFDSKVLALTSAIQETFSLDNVYAVPQYIETSSDIRKIVELNKSKRNEKEIVVIIGCVDNHRARQAMNEFFKKSANVIYIDSANEYSEGEICIGARLMSKLIAPPRAYYFPEILKDKAPKASELSCEERNNISPQHLVTNLMAAHLILTCVVKLISDNKLDCGIIYFDSFKYFSRFDQYIPDNKGGEVL